jgi:hypothetical protein
MLNRYFGGQWVVQSVQSSAETFSLWHIYSIFLMTLLRFTMVIGETGLLIVGSEIFLAIVISR